MTPRHTRFLDSLRKLPVGESVDPSELDNYLRSWGFTIYRTFYGAGSEEQWDRLLQNITNGAKYGLSKKGGPDDDPTITSKVEDLFKLDARSDPATLDCLTLEEVRQLYHEGTGGQPMNTDNGPWRVFILADAEVLADPDLEVIKCVAADYDAAACVPKNWKYGPQRYFGWIRMSSRHVLTLWEELGIYFFKEIGEHTAGGPGAWWDAEAEDW